MTVGLRVVRVAGGSPLRVGESVAVGRGVAASEGDVGLEFERGARVEVERGGRIVRSVASPAGIAIGEGALRAVLLPEGNSARPALRIATPGGVVAVEGSGEIFVAVLPDGAAYVAALQGLSEVSTGAVDAVGAPEIVRLVAGRALVLGGEATAPTAGPSTLAEARSRATRLARTHRASRGARERMRGALASDVAARLAAFDAELARGDELRERHRAAVAARAGEATELQRAIVAHAQALLRARRAAQASFERAEALAGILEDGEAWLGPMREKAAVALRIAR